MFQPSGTWRSFGVTHSSQRQVNGGSETDSWLAGKPGWMELRILSCTISLNLTAFDAGAAANARAAVMEQSASVLSCLWQCDGGALGQ